MNKDKLIEGKKSNFTKIKNILKNSFTLKSNQKILIVDNKDSDNSNFNINTNSEFLKEVKINTNYTYDRNYKLKKFMKELEENPDIIDNLSNDRLDKLISYYEKITNEKAKKINRLKM